MDILAHGLWAAAGAGWAHRRGLISPKGSAWTVAAAVLPDLPHMLPVLAWTTFGSGAVTAAADYAVAAPGQEPALPPMVDLLSHHLHCIFHSAIIGAITTLLVWAVLRRFWLPLLGWWSHIVIDVLSHSADFYPSPVLYPITLEGFDGWAWNTPEFMVLNYAALAATFAWLWRTRRGRGKGRIPE